MTLGLNAGAQVCIVMQKGGVIFFKQGRKANFGFAHRKT